MLYWIGLGANLGDRAANLRRAAQGLAEMGRVNARSLIYASVAIGPPQPTYLNAAVLLETEMQPSDLLASTLNLESALGRSRENEVRFGPRSIDIDLLLAGNEGEVVHQSENLQLPHPRLPGRAFALAGLAEISPDLQHPILRRTMRVLLSEADFVGAVQATGERL